jgi:hypothetical protein
MRRTETELDECCSKITSLQSDISVAENELKKISDDYRNLKLDKKVKELVEQCQVIENRVNNGD